MTARYCGPSVQFSPKRVTTAITMPARMAGMADHVDGLELTIPMNSGTVTGMPTSPSTMFPMVKMPRLLLTISSAIVTAATASPTTMRRPTISNSRSVASGRRWPL